MDKQVRAIYNAFDRKLPLFRKYRFKVRIRRIDVVSDSVRPAFEARHVVGSRAEHVAASFVVSCKPYIPLSVNTSSAPFY